MFLWSKFLGEVGKGIRPMVKTRMSMLQKLFANQRHIPVQLHHYGAE